MRLTGFAARSCASSAGGSNGQVRAIGWVAFSDAFASWPAVIVLGVMTTSSSLLRNRIS
jgi:hypothetical protein